MPNTDNEAVHTVKVPDWLKERFEDVTSEAEWAAYKKLADTIKNNSFIYMTVADLSDETLDYAAMVYSDDFYSIDPWEQKMRLDDIRDWIVALIEGGVVSVSPKHEEPVAFCDNSFFEGLEAAEKRIQQVGKTPTLIEQIPDDAWKDWDRRNEDALVVDSALDEDE